MYGPTQVLDLAKNLPIRLSQPNVFEPMCSKTTLDVGGCYFWSCMSFSKLGLSDEIVRAVTARGYTEPTPIQMQAIPAILSGNDLLAGAQTGTGKTAGFTLPILQRLSASGTPSQPPSQPKPQPRSSNLPIPRGANLPRRSSAVRALILTPTRELAAQVEESVKEYGKYLNLTSMAVFGGVNITPQMRRLKSGVDILVATPGRLLDHLQQRTVDLSQVEILVLDEADRMLDMGFIRDIRRIMTMLPAVRQNLLFSATFSPEIKALAQTILTKPVLIEVARKTTSAELIEQEIYRVDRVRKADLLIELLQINNWYQVLVFTRTKHGADRLCKQLAQVEITALAIHANKSQSIRTKTLAKFKEGTLQVLVATDIAARGIDIAELPQVVNFDLPDVPEDYVHRIGRTGRAGSSGAALSLVCIDELKLLSAIERLLKRSLPQRIFPGFEPDPRIPAEPIQRGRQSQGRGGDRQRSGGGGGQRRSSQGAAPQLRSESGGEDRRSSPSRNRR
jgi:ATP-dependent RNA helicase RhlE